MQSVWYLGTSVSQYEKSHILAKDARTVFQNESLMDAYPDDKTQNDNYSTEDDTEKLGDQVDRV